MGQRHRAAAVPREAGKGGSPLCSAPPAPLATPLTRLAGAHALKHGCKGVRGPPWLGEECSSVTQSFGHTHFHCFSLSEQLPVFCLGISHCYINGFG